MNRDTYLSKGSFRARAVHRFLLSHWRCKLCRAGFAQTVGLYQMPRQVLVCCPRSMSPRDCTPSHGATGISRCCVILFGLLLCLLAAPQCTGAAFTCPTECTCDVWKLGTAKLQNVTCSGTNLTSVPKDGKEGSDVYKL